MSVRGVFAEWQPVYAAHRIPTFPVTAEKRPATKGYLRTGIRASTLLAQKFAQADALGFACGPRSKLALIDVDSKDERVLAAALSTYGDTPVISRTPSGYHAWYRHNGEHRSIRPLQGAPLDILGGGYAVPIACVKRRLRVHSGRTGRPRPPADHPAPACSCSCCRHQRNAGHPSWPPKQRAVETLYASSAPLRRLRCAARCRAYIQRKLSTPSGRSRSCEDCQVRLAVHGARSKSLRPAWSLFPNRGSARHAARPGRILPACLSSGQPGSLGNIYVREWPGTDIRLAPSSICKRAPSPHRAWLSPAGARRHPRSARHVSMGMTRAKRQGCPKSDTYTQPTLCSLSLSLRGKRGKQEASVKGKPSRTEHMNTNYEVRALFPALSGVELRQGQPSFETIGGKLEVSACEPVHRAHTGRIHRRARWMSLWGH